MNIQPVNSGPEGVLRQTYAPARADSAAQTEDSAASDRISFSHSLTATQSMRIIVEQILVKAEGNVTPSEQLFQANGKDAYLTSVRNASDQSPDAVSGRILDGITGYIYAAFVQSHPQATAEDFAGFREQVLKGVEQGVADAREILEALSALSPELDDTIGQTVDLLQQKLSDWFEETAKQYAASAPAAE